MSNNYKTTTSLTKVLKKIVNTEINNNKPKTITGTILYRSGSDLVALNLGKLSY